jgi:hypothetical protein
MKKSEATFYPRKSQTLKIRYQIADIIPKEKMWLINKKLLAQGYVIFFTFLIP